VLATHQAAGIDVQVGVAVSDFQHDGQQLTGLNVNGQPVAVELLVLGIGASPDTALAEAADLSCSNGVLVDAFQRTSDADILAVGDCCNFPSHHTGGPLRLESVQNATDQARTALASLLGREEPYRALPWFWSEQGSLRLQMAGLLPVDAVSHRRPGASAASFTLLHYSGERLASIESVNAPVDHMTLRKIMDAGKSPAPAEICDPATPLKNFL
jgi:3-phenylpropionate/trans-cinnamate dioxygenase ferredoxin reductase subunit